MKERESWLIDLISGMENHGLTVNASGYRRLRYQLNQMGFSFKKPSSCQVFNAYTSLVDETKSKHFKWFEGTWYQRYVESIFSKNSKIQYFTNYLVGYRPVDFFIPSLASWKDGMRGLVVEIDGSIHDKEWKMRRDERLGENLQALRISHTVIRNEDITNKLSRQLLLGLRESRRICSRNTRNIIRRVQLFTLVKNFRVDDISKMYRIDRQVFSAKVQREYQLLHQSDEFGNK